MNREELIQHYMKNLGLTREEAIELIEDDENDFIGEEAEEMTRKAKELKRYEKSDKPKSKSKKERKIDETKKFLIENICSALEPLVKITNVKTETEISFVHNGENYTVKLTKHRPKK